MQTNVYFKKKLVIHNKCLSVLWSAVVPCLNVCSWYQCARFISSKKQNKMFS